MRVIRGRAEAVTGPAVLDSHDARFALGALMTVIAACIVPLGGPPGWVSGGLLFVLGVLVLADN